jgi:hypothetical protein
VAALPSAPEGEYGDHLFIVAVSTGGSSLTNAGWPEASGTAVVFEPVASTTVTEGRYWPYFVYEYLVVASVVVWSILPSPSKSHSKRAGVPVDVAVKEYVAGRLAGAPAGANLIVTSMRVFAMSSLALP